MNPREVLKILMTTSRKIVKVFLASPGDLNDERLSAKHVVDVFNRQWADNLGIHIDLIGWEDTVSRFGRPQANINRELDQCELFIGVMWKHWGTPPDQGSTYTSGFEEEFERAINNKQKLDRPEISLFFKEVDPDLLKDPGDALKKVTTFKNRIIAEKKVLFQSFGNMRVFEDQVRGSITSYVQNLKREELEVNQDDSRARAMTKPEIRSAVSPDNIFGTEGAEFLAGMIAGKDFVVSPAEVARLRLLGMMVSADGNDEEMLGAHDSNILYSSDENLQLGSREANAIFRSSLAHYGNDNVPLWHWYRVTNALERGLLSLNALSGQSACRIGALRAMRVVAEPIVPLLDPDSSDVLFDRSQFVEAWLLHGSDARIKAAALEYLAVCGVSEDIPLIEKEFERGDYQTIGPAAEAIIRLKLRDSRESAITALYGMQSDSIDGGLVGELFQNAARLDANLLTAGIPHRSPLVRRAVVSELVARDLLDQEVAERLLADSDPAVRHAALRALVARGKEFSDDQAKSILVKRNARAGLGVLWNMGASDAESGEAEWQKYRLGKLRASPDIVLESASADVNDFLEGDAKFALDFKHFGKRSEALRAAIDDRFKKVFDSKVRDIEGRRSVDGDTLDKLRSIEEFVRKKFCRKALNILCEKGSEQDLARVRKALSDGFVELSEVDIDYLGRHGEWRDVNLLLSLAGRRVELQHHLLIPDDSIWRAIGSSIYWLARGRLADVVALKPPDAVLSKILVRAKDREIASISTDLCLGVLRSSSEALRKVLVLKLVRAVPKRRLREVLNRYMERDGQRYYNVVHWLDFGISLPRHRAIEAAARALEKMR